MQVLTPKSVILDLLSTDLELQLPSAALVRAGAVFGFESGAMRVALSRLVRGGEVLAESRGFVRLSPSARELARHVTGWRSIESKVRPWSGGWLAAATGGLPNADRPALRRRQRALDLWGFAQLRPGLMIRPDNLTIEVTTLRQRLVDLGLDATAPVFAAGDLGGVQAEAINAWPGAALSEAYRDHRERLLRCAAALPGRTADEAARDTFLAGGDVLHLLAYDPLLPEPIVDADARRALVDEMVRFDVLGRAAWQRVLTESEVRP